MSPRARAVALSGDGAHILEEARHLGTRVKFPARGSDDRTVRISGRKQDVAVIKAQLEALGSMNDMHESR